MTVDSTHPVPLANAEEISTRFLSLSVPLHPSPVVLRDRVESLLRSHGAPLRWAITSVDAAQQTAQIEAVVTLTQMPQER